MHSQKIPGIRPKLAQIPGHFCMVGQRGRIYNGEQRRYGVNRAGLRAQTD